MAPEFVASPPDAGLSQEIREPFRQVLQGDARDLRKLLASSNPLRVAPLTDKSVDLVVTSPPYWRKRDYKLEGQIGQEETPEEYVAEIIKAIKEWRRVLRASGSIFVNIGDTYWRKSLSGIPSLIESHARLADLVVRNRIVWIKKGGRPEPARDR